MNKVMRLLLQQLNVMGFVGASVSGLHDSREESYGRYVRAFEGVPQSQVVVVIDEFGQIFIVDDFDRLWSNRSRFQHGIQTVLRVPKEIWEKILPNLESQDIHDLTGPKAA